MPPLTHASLAKQGCYRGLSLAGADPATARALHRFMLRLRRCEEALIREYHPADEMRCPVHFCVGQEAVSASLSLLLRPEDLLFSHHRSHGYFLAKGAPMRALFAELYGKATGANGGMAGSQDISYGAANFYSGAILAGAVAIAAGAGLGLQLKGKDAIAVAGFGEGATDEGVFWEAVNYAALRKLPVLFVCENNLYATYSHQLKRQPSDNISEKVTTFGIPARQVFGNDAIATHRLLTEAVQDVRAGKGPRFVEAYTYRWFGHVGPEDDDYLDYRPGPERTQWKENCPIALLEERMQESGLLTAAAKDALVREIDAEIADCFQFAKSSPFPAEADFERLNVSQAAPVADRLLHEVAASSFDGHQASAVPGPY